MSLSTVTFPDGNHSGFDNPERAEVESRYGLVSLGWQLRICSTAQRRSESQPCAKRGVEWSLEEQARRLKQMNPHMRVFAYRNTELALSTYSEQCAKMYDDQFAGFFLQAGGKILNDRAQAWQFEPCGPNVNASALVQDQFFTDFRNSSAADWFVNAVVGGAARSRHIDGVWFDDTSGIGEEHPGVSRHFSPQEIHDIKSATQKALERAEDLLVSSNKFSYHLFEQLPLVRRSTCADDLRSGAAIGAMNAFSVMQIPYFAPNASGPTVQHDFQQQLAAFLLVRGDYSWMGHSWIATKPPVWYPEWSVDYGKPISGMHEDGSVFSRRWSKCNVHLDCQAFVARFEFLEGAVLV